jgi:ribonuclease BN (tRNA processing enzyme)
VPNEITLLCENAVSDMRWRAEWGFSAFIEAQGARGLVDTGFSDVWRFNADLAGIDLETTDFVALSHIHRDHTRGLLHHPFRSRKKLILHPRILEPAPAIRDDVSAPCAFSGRPKTVAEALSACGNGCRDWPTAQPSRPVASGIPVRNNRAEGLSSAHPSIIRGDLSCLICWAAASAARCAMR